MNTTALFRTYRSGNGFLLTLTNIDSQTVEQFRLHLHSKQLANLLPDNFSCQVSKQVGFESRASSPDKLRELELTIKEFCWLYRICYRTEPMEVDRRDTDIAAIGKAG